MKNIHLIPTDKPTGIWKLGDNLHFSIMDKVRTDGTGFHLYITSNEEIKDGNYYITPNNTILKALGSMVINVEDYKKIILTTDQDLIKDGVQVIDDKFLEWFVKNSSCEEVEVINEQYTQNYHKDIWYNRYKIIIPIETPIQKIPQLGTKEFNDLASAYFGGKPKQETLEEGAERLSELQEGTYTPSHKITYKHGFTDGAKWQSKRIYSEEEVFNICRVFATFVMRTGPSYKKQQEWFEQFKKK